MLAGRRRGEQRGGNEPTRAAFSGPSLTFDPCLLAAIRPARRFDSFRTLSRPPDLREVTRGRRRGDRRPRAATQTC